jgi:hypothetical protein
VAQLWPVAGSELLPLTCDATSETFLRIEGLPQPVHRRLSIAVAFDTNSSNERSHSSQWNS